MPAALVLDAARTPIGRLDGGLAGWHPADLLATLLVALAGRTGLDPATVDDVVVGCAMTVGSQGFNVARNAVLAAGWPDSVPGGVVERQGVSSFAAVRAAVAAVESGAADLVVAGGVEVMSTTPAGATLVPGAMPFGPAMAARYRDAGGLVPAGVAAEALGHPRAALDEWAARSHARVAADPSIVPVGSITRDETAAPPTAADLADAKPLFTPDGSVTARNTAPGADGAAALLIGSAAAAARLGVEPLARVVATAEVGVDPVQMLTGAGPATELALTRAAFDIDSIDRIEIAEPFAAVPLTWLAATGAAPERVNPGGGGIALGEPTGAVGARLLATLVHGVERRGLALGVSVGGLGAAIVVERP